MRAPAKINLALHVTGQREDGYHLLESLAAFTDFGDVVTVGRSDADQFEIEGPFASALPADGSNIVISALELFRRETGTRDPVSISLEKHIPVASGIGGGSADAAACLRALNSVFSTGLSLDELAELGAVLGADVAMCVYSKPLIAKGIGEKTELVKNFPALDVVLLNPLRPVSTPEVFSRLANKVNSPLPPLPDFNDLVSLCDWLSKSRNDLEEPARPAVPEICLQTGALEKAGSLFSRMSGSGATCFGIFSNGEEAMNAADKIRLNDPNWFAVATRTLGADRVQ